MFRKYLLVTTCLASVHALADTADEQRLNFKSCPIVRDTATVPCWLSEYDGELYYLGIQTDISSEFHPPYLGHQVIVEGVVSDQPRICGGIVLEPVVISPVAELDPSCNQMLPADDRYVIDFNPRPPGPSGGTLAFQNAPRRQAPEEPQPPCQARDFVIQYYFDGKVEARNAGELRGILRYVQQIGAGRVEITGYSGDVLLSDGGLLRERQGLERARAEEVTRLLKEAGMEVADVDVSWTREASADGVEDWRERKTVVKVIPSE